MTIDEKFRSIIIIALVDFESKQRNDLIEFAERYKATGNNFENILNCVDLYKKAVDCLTEIRKEKTNDT